MKRKADGEPELDLREAPLYDEDAAGPDVRTEEDILQLLEQAPAVEALDLFGLKKQVLAFERKLTRNQEMRVKFPDQPDKFVDSEVELHDEIKKMHVVAASPELFADLVELNATQSITGLLAHENTDIAGDALELLQELTEPDAVANLQDSAVLVDALLANNVVELLVENLKRLDEGNESDAKAVHNSLNIIENMIEVKPEVTSIVCQKTPLMKWLIGRLRVREFDQNKLYASEILAILLQQSKENRETFSDPEKLDHLLRLVAVYKKRTPGSSEEEEVMENLFDCVAAALLHPPVQATFIECEGIELMLLITKEQPAARRCTLKVLDFALQRCGGACERFVDALGLKTIFSAYMQKGSYARVKKKRSDEEGDAEEEHIVSSIASLFIHLKGQRMERLLGKFEESDFEKIDRTMDLFDKFYRRVQECESEFLKDHGRELSEEDKEYLYLEKLEHGQFTLQNIALVIAHVIKADMSGARDRILIHLKQHDRSPVIIKGIIQELVENFGDAVSVDERERQLEMLRELANVLAAVSSQ
eukprot:tig00000203_g17117.t1